jgi:hypothetical protein
MLKQMGITHLAQLVDQDIKRVLGKLGMDNEEAQEAQKALERVPLVDMKWSLIPVDEQNQPLENSLLEESGEA